MSGKWLQSFMARRSFLARLGMGAGVLGAAGIGAPGAAAQATSDASNVPWRPAHHAQDDWYDKIPGQHRFVFDSTTPEGLALAMRFANNYFTANQNAYGLKDSDLAVVIVARHKSTSFAYTDAIWAKYGKQLSEQAEFTDPKTKEPPKANLYAGPGDGSDQSGAMDTLIKRGRNSPCAKWPAGPSPEESRALPAARSTRFSRRSEQTSFPTRNSFQRESWR